MSAWCTRLFLLLLKLTLSNPFMSVHCVICLWHFKFFSLSICIRLMNDLCTVCHIYLSLPKCLSYFYFSTFVQSFLFVYVLVVRICLVHLFLSIFFLRLVIFKIFLFWSSVFRKSTCSVPNAFKLTDSSYKCTFVLCRCRCHKKY